MPQLFDFDSRGLFCALEDKKRAEELSWRQVADEIWALSAELNARRNDHPISPSTITNLGKRRDTSGQHALFYLRWLDRPPESFLAAPAGSPPAGYLPAAGPDRRLRWHLKRLYAALDQRRRAEALTWSELAGRLECTPNQLTGIATARFTTGMNLAMHIVQWLGQPAGDYIYPASW
jgi:hypothetical protein